MKRPITITIDATDYVNNSAFDIQAAITGVLGKIGVEVLSVELSDAE